MLQSLRTRLFMSHLAVVLLVFLLTTVVAFVPIRQTENRLEVQRLETLAAPLAYETGIIQRRQPSSDVLVNEILDAEARRTRSRLVLFDRQGQVIHDTESGAPLSASFLNFLRSPMSKLVSFDSTLEAVGRVSGTVSTLSVGVHQNQRIVLASVPYTNNLVLALLSPARTFPLTRTLILPLGLAAAVGLLGAVIATAFLSRSIARPISRLTEAADAVAGGDLRHRVPNEGSDEVGHLVHSFNGMVERLQATAESQRRLLANVAHELRTPLTSIQGYAQGLRDGIFSTKEEQAEALETIGEESERVNYLVVQVLQLARLESGQAEPHPTVVELEPVIGRILRRHRVEAENAGIEMVGEVDDNRPVLADEALLDQAIDNLVRNALEHTPSGGRIRIAAAPAFAPASGATRYRIRVSDTGSGIPPEQIPHIFDRFYRVDTRVSSGTGFGLGLAIVREIVVGHGGQVGVESQPGQGTTFIIDLPFDASLAAREASRAAI